MPQNIGLLARNHEQISLLFMDICGFTHMSKCVSAGQVMGFLNELFSLFDALVEVHGVHKVETAGDCYIVSAGIMVTQQTADGFMHVADSHDPADSAARVMAFARDMMTAARCVRMPNDGQPVQVRIGIHTGPCTSGLIGSKLPKFSIFGDSMNTASRMESTAPPGHIQVSEATHALLPHEVWEATGGVEVKGKGLMQTYLWCGTCEAAPALPGFTLLHGGQSAADALVSEPTARLLHVTVPADGHGTVTAADNGTQVQAVFPLGHVTDRGYSSSGAHSKSSFKAGPSIQWDTSSSGFRSAAHTLMDSGNRLQHGTDMAAALDARDPLSDGTPGARPMPHVLLDSIQQAQSLHSSNNSFSLQQLLRAATYSIVHGTVAAGGSDNKVRSGAADGGALQPPPGDGAAMDSCATATPPAQHPSAQLLAPFQHDVGHPGDNSASMVAAKAAAAPGPRVVMAASTGAAPPVLGSGQVPGVRRNSLSPAVLRVMSLAVGRNNMFLAGLPVPGSTSLLQSSRKVHSQSHMRVPDDMRAALADAGLHTAGGVGTTSAAHLLHSVNPVFLHSPSSPAFASLMHGAVKGPTYATASRELLAGSSPNCRHQAHSAPLSNLAAQLQMARPQQSQSATNMASPRAAIYTSCSPSTSAQSSVQPASASCANSMQRVMLAAGEQLGSTPSSRQASSSTAQAAETQAHGQPAITCAMSLACMPVSLDARPALARAASGTRAAPQPMSPKGPMPPLCASWHTPQHTPRTSSDGAGDARRPGASIRASPSYGSNLAAAAGVPRLLRLRVHGRGSRSWIPGELGTGTPAAGSRQQPAGADKCQ